MTSSLRHDYKNIKPVDKTGQISRPRLSAFSQKFAPKLGQGYFHLSLAFVGVALIAVAMLGHGKTADVHSKHSAKTGIDSSSSWLREQPLMLPKATLAGAVDAVIATDIDAGTKQAHLQLKISRGDTLGDLFKKHELDYNDLHTLLSMPDIRPHLTRVQPGDIVDVLHEHGRLLSLTRVVSESQRLQVSRNTDSELVAQLQDLPLERRQRHAIGTVDSSLFLSGKEAGLSDRTVMNLAGVFAWDIDFILDIRKGDQFSVIYEEIWRDGEHLRDGDIVAAEFVNQGESFRAARYEDPEGRISYFAPDGRSVRKAFLRAPLPFTPRVTSNFNPRRLHPIKKVRRPHRGVDYGASTGTRILAAGDGKIAFRGWKGGYGNTIIVEHGGNISTLYAHMSKFKSSVKNGSRVRQGDTIGYVGATGYATGPHLHYEYRINGVHKNPRTVKLPEAKPIAPEFREHFEAQIAPLMARLDTFSRSQSQQLVAAR
ncbi:MAG: peptidoglycan DD-metalloendopeptidase family protein [Gammaproteobacteria bacterium]|nr:peptidoglycan DD-metalloendopeptidase family protein [Gammaproteobacteria bacterium]